MAGKSSQRLHQRGTGEVSPKGARTLDTDRQEPRGPLPEGARLGAIPRTPRITPGMAVPEGSVTNQFPVCSRSVPSARRRKWSWNVGVPSVPRHGLRPKIYAKTAGRLEKHTSTTWNIGTVRTLSEIKGVPMERSRNRLGEQAPPACPRNKAISAFTTSPQCPGFSHSWRAIGQPASSFSRSCQKSPPDRASSSQLPDGA